MQNVLKKGLASGKLPSSDPLARHVAGHLDRAAAPLGRPASPGGPQVRLPHLHPVQAEEDCAHGPGTEGSGGTLPRGAAEARRCCGQ